MGQCTLGWRFGVVAVVAATAVGAGAKPPAIRAVRAARAPVLDGRLDDPCWAAATPVTGFQRINTKSPAACQTIAYVACDATHLYVAAKCLEPDPRRIRAKARPRDRDGLFGDDIVEIMLDPTRSQSDYYQLVVSAAGATFDAFRRNGGRLVDDRWDGRWQAKAFVGADHWSVEVAIPFASLGLTPQVASTWGFNLCREKPNPAELSSLGLAGAFNSPKRFRVLTGLDVDFKPYCFGIGPAVTALKRHDGRLCAVGTIPVVNHTGRRRAVRVRWRLGQAEDSRQVALEPGESLGLPLAPRPLEPSGHGPGRRLALPAAPEPVEVVVEDAQHAALLACASVRLPAMRADMTIDTAPLRSRAAFEQPPADIAFAVKISLDKETLRAGTLEVTLTPLGGTKPVAARTFRSPSPVTRVTFPAKDIAWGAYGVRAALADAQDKPVLSADAEIPVLPRGAERVRVLNNLVAELRSIAEPQAREHKQFAFMNPRRGWVFFSSQASGKGAIGLEGEEQPLLVHQGETRPVEAMRWLPAGRHTATVQAGPGFALQRLVVRAIPELQYCNFPTPPLIAGFGPYDRKFVARHVLPNCNVIVGAADETTAALMRDWTAQGKRWIMRSNVPGLHKHLKTDVDSVYTFWSGHPGLAHPLMSGAIADEFGASRAEMYPTWTAALRRIAAEPRFAGRRFYPYTGSTHSYAPARPFVETVFSSGWALAWERYLQEQPTEKEARAYIDASLVQEARAWSAAFPGALGQIVVVVGYFDTPWCSLNVHPTTNFLTYLDMQFSTLANDPAFWRLHGLQTYLSYFCDAETVHWGGKLYRHYAIEGKTGPMTHDPYELTHLRNPDFDDGTRHWTVQPAEPGSIEARHMAGLSVLQMRYPRTSQGEHFLWTKRSARRPNRVSQPIRDLVPGRRYSLKLYTADYQNLEAGRSVKEPNAVSITIEGGRVLPRQSFQSSFHSCYAAGAFTRKKRAWLNYHWRVFEATATSGRLVISDWAAADKPGGPVGQELAFNFIELQPYTGP